MPVLKKSFQPQNRSKTINDRRAALFHCIRKASWQSHQVLSSGSSATFQDAKTACSMRKVQCTKMQLETCTASAMHNVQHTPSKASAMHSICPAQHLSCTASAKHGICHAQHLPCTASALHDVQGTKQKLWRTHSWQSQRYHGRHSAHRCSPDADLPLMLSTG